MSISHQRPVRSRLVLPVLALGMPVVLGLTGCGSSTSNSAPTTSMPVNSTTTGATSTDTNSTDAGSNTATSTGGSANGGAVAPGSTATVSTTTTVTASAGSSSRSSEPEGGSGPTINVGDLGSVAFASPSGRIQCQFVSEGRGYVECAVEGANWTPHAGTPACDQGQGDEVDLKGTGRGELTCHTDNDMGSAVLGQDGTGWTGRHAGTIGTWNGKRIAVLPYGTTLLLANDMTCTSRTTGMTCTNMDRHSFTAARQGYSVS